MKLSALETWNNIFSTLRPTPPCSKKQGGRRWTLRLTDLLFGLSNWDLKFDRCSSKSPEICQIGRFKPVTLPALLRQGACEFAWVNPKEEPTEPTNGWIFRFLFWHPPKGSRCWSWTLGTERNGCLCLPLVLWACFPICRFGHSFLSYLIYLCSLSQGRRSISR